MSPEAEAAASRNDPGSEPTSSRDAILAAATVELAEKGFRGARIEHIARRAGFNKALVYRYFGDREGLIREVLRRQLRRRQEIFAAVPDDLGAALVHWYRETAPAGEFLRLLMHEALNDRDEEVVEEAARRDYYAHQIANLKARQESGGVAADFNAKLLFLALLALISYPAFFPQVTRLATGLEADSPRFRKAWGRLLEQLAGRLAPRG